MDEKLEKTVVKTVDALARIERFVKKYGAKLDDAQKNRISEKIKELQRSLKKLSSYLFAKYI